MRRDFDLPASDIEYLDATGLPWETVLEGDVRWLFVHDRGIPAGYQASTALTALRIVPQYPDSALDMVWFFPPLARSDGRPINALSPTVIEGRTFQQWSRHRTGVNGWRPGIDDIAAQLLLVDEWLGREFRLR